MAGFADLFGPRANQYPNERDWLVAFLSQVRSWRDNSSLLRASSLPFCGRRWSLTQALDQDDRPLQTRSFVQDAILKCGTTLHDVLRAWMPHRLYGDFTCPACGHTVNDTVISPSLVCPNRRCSRHGLPLIYKELELRHPTLPFTAHPDGGLLREGKRLVLLEIKTTEQEKLIALTEPDPTHLNYQAAAYAWLLRKVRHLRVRRVVLFYLARNLPWTHQALFSRRQGADFEVLYKSTDGADKTLLKVFSRKLDLSLVESEFARIQAAFTASRNGRRLLSCAEWGICKDAATASTTWCPFRYLCFASWVDKKYSGA